MNNLELATAMSDRQNYLCVGLDPDWNKIPEYLKKQSSNALFEFNKAIIDATAPHCVAYKLNVAFYECHGIYGMVAFKDTIDYLKHKYPRKFIIADAKRADIGNTSKMYAKAYFEYYDVDAVTVPPYMGKDSVKPFFEYKDKWVVVLALTSNEGSNDFQMVKGADNGLFLYEHVLETASQWGNPENTMFVVGATKPEETLAEIRRNYPDHFLLIPGVGAQGGDLAQTSKAGFNDIGGILINSSRAIIHAGEDENFAIKAREAAQIMAGEMRELWKERP